MCLVLRLCFSQWIFFCVSKVAEGSSSLSPSNAAAAVQTNPAAVSTNSRAYPLGCSEEKSSYYDYESYPFPPPGCPIHSSHQYQLVERLGSGKFSDVFSAVPPPATTESINTSSSRMAQIDPSSLVVIKCLKPIADRKVKRELLVLSHTRGLPNHAQLSVSFTRSSEKFVVAVKKVTASYQTHLLTFHTNQHNDQNNAKWQRLGNCSATQLFLFSTISA